jgi:hypothetical protein
MELTSNKSGYGDDDSARLRLKLVIGSSLNELCVPPLQLDFNRSIFMSFEKLLSVYGTPSDAACERFSAEKLGPILIIKLLLRLMTSSLIYNFSPCREDCGLVALWSV